MGNPRVQSAVRGTPLAPFALSDALLVNWAVLDTLPVPAAALESHATHSLDQGNPPVLFRSTWYLPI